ncbi:ATPase, T2SS/T4P/T4SS family [Pseudomonas aeruginosa]
MVWEEGEQLLFAARDPLSPSIRETLGYFYPERSIQAVLCRSQDLDGWLEHSLDLARQCGSARLRQRRHPLPAELAEEAPVVELVNNVMSQAMEKRSSDIHIEPREFDFRIRFRVDGVPARPPRSLPRERFAAVVSRIKLISAIDIAGDGLPQDGRMSIRVSGTGSTCGSPPPGVHGESVVMRLLPKEREGLRLDRLGMLRTTCGGCVHG